jgi:peptidoglycan/xylan/chitin deacetylase (PgdA/CDA1 family)
MLIAAATQSKFLSSPRGRAAGHHDRQPGRDRTWQGFRKHCQVMMLSHALLAVPVAAGICAWGVCDPRSQLFGPTQRRTDRRRTLALTFDDGPNPAVTPQLLDLLDKYGSRATFFLIGRNVRACPALAAEIVRRGHAIGNHTDTHPNLVWLSREEVVDELSRCSAAILAATGQRPTIMRPPYGYRGPQLHAAVRQAGFEPPIMWSRSGYDWNPQPASKLIHRLRTVRSRDIVLLHDGAHDALGGKRQHTIEALEYWLPRWKAQGLDLVPLSLPMFAGTKPRPSSKHTVHKHSL